MNDKKYQFGDLVNELREQFCVDTDFNDDSTTMEWEYVEIVVEE